MGFINLEIYRLRKILILFCLLMISALYAGKKTDEQVIGYNVTVPFYQDDSAVPVIILYAEEAKPIGVRFELKGVTVHWIGATVDETKGAVKTPSAVYDKTTQTIYGNDKITYRSAEMDLDGVGFDIDQIKQFMHIRSKVRLVLKQRLQHERGKSKTTVSPFRKLKMGGPGKGLIIKPIYKKNTKTQKDISSTIEKKISTNKKNNTDTKKQENVVVSERKENKNNMSVIDSSTLLWLGVMAGAAIVIVMILNFKNRRRQRGKRKS